jgi:hypothetical protein
MMNTKMIHYEWDDYIIISNNRIKRCEGSNDEGDVIFYNNIIEVKWDKWDVEYYLLYNNNIILLIKIIIFILILLIKFYIIHLIINIHI